MRRRMLAILIAFLMLGVVVIAKPTPTHAMQTWVQKVKSDCTSVKARVTLVYNHDDTGDEEQRDYFRVEIFDMANNYLTHFDESVTKEQSPYYWHTGRVAATPWNGKYHLVIWDTTDDDKKIRKIEDVWHDCTTGATWRPEKPLDDNPEIPYPTCYTWVPLFTTNLAPERGGVMVMWSYDTDRKDNPEYVEYHLATIQVKEGEGLDEPWVRAPCGVYVKLYYMPDSTKNLYFMPSQYYPYDFYGTANYDTVNPVYHTFFPLDGPPRPPDEDE